MPLKNVCNLRTMGISEKVEINLISFFDYGLVEVGGYFNVAIDQTGDYSNNLSSLTKVNDVRGFTYWAGPKNWIYESGADNSGVYIPEIYVNNSLYSLISSSSILFTSVSSNSLITSLYFPCLIRFSI